MRINGFYFVAPARGGRPFIAEWSCEKWFLAGIDGGFRDDEYVELIGPITHSTENVRVSKAEYLPQDRNARLFKLIEEMGELAHALGKAGRWGMLSANPEIPRDQQETNAAWILREMLDVEQAIAACRPDVLAEIAERG